MSMAFGLDCQFAGTAYPYVYGQMPVHRGFFYARLAQADKSLYKIGELMGHPEVEVTRMYAHLTPKSLAPVVQDLDFE